MKKHCWVCKTHKDVSLFGQNKSKKDKLSSECRECKRKIDREYASKNREKAKVRAQKWFYDNHEYALQRGREKGKIWRQQNPDKNCAKSNKKRASTLQATPKWLTKEQLTDIKNIYTDAKELEKIFPWKQNVDHIVPLKNKDVCGLHVSWNLQILRAERNFSKGNKHVCE